MRQYCGHCQKEVEVIADLRTQNKVCAVCGSIFQQHNQLPPGTIISGYMIESELGRGAMGIVYKAKQINLERHVALKILSDELSSDMDFVDRFFKEARAAASLSHPNVVHAYDAGATPDGIYYLAMELIEGETLDVMIEREKRLPVGVALNIALKIAAALNYAWNKESLSHGDVKPDNIIVNESGEIKLADLGLAKTRKDEIAEDDLFATPLYAPPEVIRGEVGLIGAKSDMYSFGASLYHMICGEPPFPGEDADKVMNAHVSKQPVPLAAKRKGVNTELSHLVDRLLGKRIEDRPDNWEEIIAALERSGQPKEHSRNFSYFFLGRSANPWVFWAKLLGVVVVILVLIIGAVLFLNRSKKEPDKPLAPGADTPVETMETEWTRLQSELKYSSNQKALAMLDEFIERFGATVPEEAKRLRSELAQKVTIVEKTKDQVRIRDDFVEGVNALANSLPEAPALRTLSNQRLLALEKQVKTTLAKEQNQPQLNDSIPAECRRRFDMTLTMIKRISSHRMSKAGRKKGSGKKHATPKGAGRDVEAKKKPERKPVKTMPVEEAANVYYGLLSDVIANFNPMNPAASASTIREFSENGRLGSDFAKKLDFLASKLNDCPPINRFFTDHPVCLEGEPLPIKSVPPEFKVFEISPESIKMFAKNKYETPDGSTKWARIGKIIHWEDLPPSAVKNIMAERLLDAQARDALSKEDLNKAVTLLIVAGGVENEEEFQRLTSFLSEAERWRNMWSDLANCHSELNAYKNWERIQDRLAEKDYVAVSDLLMDMSADQKETRCYRRHQKALAAMTDKYGKLSPATEARAIYEKCVQSVKEQNPTHALAAAMTLKSRYAKNAHIPSDLKKQFVDASSKALKLAKSATRVSTIKDTTIPFYYWEFDRPGEARFYSEIAEKSPLLTGYPSVLKGLSLAAALDCGDWLRARERFSNFTKEDASSLKNVKTSLVNWVPALFFGYGYAAMRFNDNTARDEVAERLFVLTINPPSQLKDTTLVSTLAMEYMLLARDPRRALELGRTHQFTPDGDPKLDVRILMLRLSSILQIPAFDDHRLVELIARIKPFFDKAPELANDFRWCEAGAHLLRNMPDLSDEELGNLKNNKCVAPDLCARFLLDVVTSRRLRPDDSVASSSTKAFHDLINAKVSGNLLSGELWGKWMVFKLAETPLGEWPELLDELLSDERICALSHYPKLVMLKTAANVALQRMTPAMGAEYLRCRLDSCPVASVDERKSPLMLNEDPSIPLKTVGDAVFNAHHQSAYWLGVLGALGNLDKPKTAMKLIDLIDQNDQRQSLQERYLAQCLRRVIKRRGK